jgi:hypothetical protein
MDSVQVLARRGWSEKGSSAYSRQFSPRQSCIWTDKEDYDLIRQYEYGVPVAWIAEYHQRSLGGINSRLYDPLRAQAGHDRYVAGIPKPKVKLKTYNCKSARRAAFRKNIKEKQHGTEKRSDYH